MKKYTVLAMRTDYGLEALELFTGSKEGKGLAWAVKMAMDKRNNSFGIVTVPLTKENRDFIYPQYWEEYGVDTSYEVCEIIDGSVRRYYRAPKGTAYMSRNKASVLSYTEALEVIKEVPTRDLFIQSENDCHFREVDEEGRIIS